MHFTLYAGTWMSCPELNFYGVQVIEILICESRFCFLVYNIIAYEIIKIQCFD